MPLLVRCRCRAFLEAMTCFRRVTVGGVLDPCGCAIAASFIFFSSWLLTTPLTRPSIPSCACEGVNVPASFLLLLRSVLEDM